MIIRTAAILLASLLALNASAQPAEAPTLLTAPALSQAIADGNLEQVVAEALGDSPTQGQINALEQALNTLATSSPADAAAAAQAVVSSGWAIAGDNPQGSIDVITAAMSTLTNPAVAAAAPAMVGQALADVQGAVTLAKRAAASLCDTYTSAQRAATNMCSNFNAADIADQASNFAQSNASILASVPNFDQLAADAIELADAQADLAGIAPAAGGGGGCSSRPARG